MGQFGRAKNPDGSGGTTPADLQAYLGAQWINAAKSPMLRGGNVTGRSDLAYAYSAGAAVVATSDGAIVVTWPAGQTALVTTPGSARVDTIYVGSDGLVRVAAGTNPSGAAAVLGKRSLPGGSTATSASTSVHNRVWALPYGSTLGWLGTHKEIHAHGTEVTRSLHTVAQIGFWVPTDRNILVHVQQGIYGTHTSENEQDARWIGIGAMRWRVLLDNTLISTFEMQYTRVFSPSQFMLPVMNVAEGEHTLKFERSHPWGAIPRHFGGGVDLYEPGFLGIIDKGVAE